MKKIIDKLYKKFLNDFLKFGLVGIINTLLSLMIFKILINYSELHYLICSAISYLLGILNSYFLNMIFVFKKEFKINSGVKFFLIYISSFLINIIMLYIFVDYLKINKMISQILVVSINTIYNFLLVRFFVT